MRRITSQRIVISSAVMCVAAAALWVRSYRHVDAIMNPERGIPSGVLRTRVGASSCRGEIFIVLAAQRETYGEGWWFSGEAHKEFMVLL